MIYLYFIQKNLFKNKKKLYFYKKTLTIKKINLIHFWIILKIKYRLHNLYESYEIILFIKKTLNSYGLRNPYVVYGNTNDADKLLTEQQYKLLLQINKDGMRNFKAKAGLSRDNESKACKFLIKHAPLCFLLSRLLQIFKAKAAYLKEKRIRRHQSRHFQWREPLLQPISPEALATLSTSPDSAGLANNNDDMST